MKEVITIEELKEIQAGQNYRHMGLFDTAGSQLVPFNPNKEDVSVRLRKIETRLLSPALPSGYYLVMCKNSAGRNVKPDTYRIYKGDKLSEGQAPPPIIQEPVKFQPEVLTYESALKLQVEVATLKLENEALKKENAELINELAELQKEKDTVLSEAQETGGMWENAKSFLSEIVQIGAPLLDKHFELKEKALTLEAMKIQRQVRRPDQKPKQQESPDVKPGSGRNYMEQIIIGYQDDLEVYEELVKLYNTALDEEDFLNNVKTFNPAIYEDFARHGK